MKGIERATQKRWPWRTEITRDTIREMTLDEQRLKELIKERRTKDEQIPKLHY